ncbi:SGNH/GDSL hydrolase family protein [Gemmiger sp.]
MDYQNINFHNVEELEPTENGLLLRRVKAETRARISTGVNENRFATGVELRFTMPDGAVDLLLRAVPQAESATAHIYFGSFQGGWEYSSKNIGADTTRIHIAYPAKLDTLRRLTAEKHLPFAPEVVRVVLPYVPVAFVGVEGRTALPTADQLPQKTYLAYGSSITHGSLCLIQPDSYVFRTAQALGVDYLNLGFAGNALMEEEMAKYIVSRKDWDFASVEMGINTAERVDEFPLDVFEERIDRFTAVLAADPRPIFATSFFGYLDEDTDRTRKMRKIVRRYAGERLIFTDGLQLFDNPLYVSADGVHPDVRGQEQIARRWGCVMRETLQNRAAL